MSGNGISWATHITTPASHHSIFYRLDALTAAQTTASKIQSTEGVLYSFIIYCISDFALISHSTNSCIFDIFRAFSSRNLNTANFIVDWHEIAVCCTVWPQLCYIVRMSFGSHWKCHMSGSARGPNTQYWKQLLRRNVANVYGNITCGLIFV